MNQDEIRRRIRAVVMDYDRVVAALERKGHTERRKAPHKEVLDDFLMSGDLKQTALAFDLSPSGVYGVIYKAIRIAETLAVRDFKREQKAMKKRVH